MERVDRVSVIKKVSEDVQTIVTSAFREPIIVVDGLLEIEQRNQIFLQSVRERGLTASQARQENAERWCRRPIPLFGLDKIAKDWWAIRPFWRDHIKVAPPLPIRGRSGKLYKHSDRIPLWEYRD